MKKVIYLTKYELKQLKKTIFISAIILTIFLAALFGVISAQRDLMRNFCDYIDSQQQLFELQLCNYNTDSIYPTFGDVADYGKYFVHGFAGEWTTTLYCSSGKSADMLYVEQKEIADGVFMQSSYSFSAKVLCLSNGLNAFFDRYKNRLAEGRWVNAPFEICLSRFVATMLDARIGDTVAVSDYQLTVVGIYNWEDNSDLSEGVFGELPAYVASVDDSVLFERVYVSGFTSASSLFDAYRKLQRKGFDMYADYDYLYENINVVQAIFTAVDIVFGIVTILVLYSLVSMLFRQRKTQICRLKILGASNKLVAGVYCGIVVTLLLAVVLFATAIGVGFNYYFMDLCEALFEFPFHTRFVVYAPFVSFGVFCVATYGMWALINRKTSALATEIRYE